jgi:DNA mismatch repair protein MutS
LVNDEEKLAWDRDLPSVLLTRRPAWAFAFDAAMSALTQQFGTAGLEGFGFEESDRLAVRAAGAILDYLRETQKTSLDHFDRLIPYRQGASLEIDEATRRSLELTRTIRGDGRDGSLLAVLDRTTTAMGARLLGEWLANPLTDVAGIEARLDAVEELMGEDGLRGQLRESLRGVYDLQRLLARVTTGRASPRDLNSIGRTLAELPKLKAKLTARRSGLLCQLEADLDLCPEVRSKLESALVSECPLTAREGGFIRDGFDPELDRLRELAAGGSSGSRSTRLKPWPNRGFRT